jgi:hypothetical protein
VLEGYPLDQQPVLFDRPREREWRRMTKFLLRGVDPLTNSHQIFCFCFSFAFRTRVAKLPKSVFLGRHTIRTRYHQGTSPSCC